MLEGAGGVVAGDLLVLGCVLASGEEERGEGGRTKHTPSAPTEQAAQEPQA